MMLPAQHIARTFFGRIYIQRDRTPQELQFSFYYKRDAWFEPIGTKG
jgi:hypothetical protein